jgi:hypothetical protein
MSILVDIILEFGVKKGKEVENQAKIFWNLVCTGSSVKMANGLLNLLEFLVQQKIKFNENDYLFIKEEMFEKYIKLKFEKLPVLEEVHIDPESNYENPEKIDAVLEKIEAKFSQLTHKKQVKNQFAEEFIEIGEDTLASLMESLQKAYKDEKKLSILEHHISEVYASSQVKMTDYHSLVKITNKIEQILRRDKKIYKDYGKATVENFGSSANTLWSMDSDIDIVITFEKQEKPQETKSKLF